LFSRDVTPSSSSLSSIPSSIITTPSTIAAPIQQQQQQQENIEVEQTTTTSRKRRRTTSTSDNNNISKKRKSQPTMDEDVAGTDQHNVISIDSDNEDDTSNTHTCTPESSFREKNIIAIIYLQHVTYVEKIEFDGSRLKYYINDVNDKEHKVRVICIKDEMEDVWYCDEIVKCMGYTYREPVSGLIPDTSDNTFILLLNKDAKYENLFPYATQLSYQQVTAKIGFSLEHTTKLSAEQVTQLLLKNVPQFAHSSDNEIAAVTASDAPDTHDDDQSENYAPSEDEDMPDANTQEGRRRSLRPSTRSQTSLSDAIKRARPTGKKLLDTSTNISITDTDLDRLREGQFLNDNIIDYWYQRITEELSQYKSRFHIFNSHFYPLLKKDPQRAAERVSTKEKLIDKDLIFLPICEGSHWFLVVICYPYRVFNKDEEKPFLMYCDSLGNRNSTRLVNNIRE
jgi:hypothetical protein